MSSVWKELRPYCKAVLNLLIFVFIILLCMYALPQLLVFFMPFVVGGMIAIIANPLVRFFEKKLKIRRKTGTAVVIITVITLVISIGYLAGVKLVEQITAFLAGWPQMWENTQAEFMVVGARLGALYGHLPVDIQNTLTVLQENLTDYVGGLVTTVGTPTFEALSRLAKNLPSIIIGIIMSLLSSYFFIAEREFISTSLPGIIPKSIWERWHLIKNGMKRAVGGYFKAQLKIEIWIYLLLVLGMLILKIDYALVIALGVAILDFVPFFGTGAVLLPWAVIKFLSGDYTMFIGLLLIWGVSQLVRQMIQPKIMGDTIGVSPIPALFLLFIGYKMGGVLGMIVALPIGIIVKNLYDEGAFATTKSSLEILYAGINNFRRLTPEDMETVRKYKAAGRQDKNHSQEGDI